MGYYTPPSMQMGDPFFGKAFRKLKKFKFGRALGGIAGMATGLPFGGRTGPACPGMGDPFFGALLRGAGAVAARFISRKPLQSVVGAVGRGAAALGRQARTPVGRAILGGVAAGGAGALGGRLLGGGGAGAGGGGGRARMNVGNVKALRRSIRRVEGFAKLAKKTISFTKQVKLKTTKRK